MYMKYIFRYWDNLYFTIKMYLSNFPWVIKKISSSKMFGYSLTLTNVRLSVKYIVLTKVNNR